MTKASYQSSTILTPQYIIKTLIKSIFDEGLITPAQSARLSSNIGMIKTQEIEEEDIEYITVDVWRMLVSGINDAGGSTLLTDQEDLYGS